MTISWRELEAEVAATLGSRLEARWIIERASGFEGAERLAHGADAVSQRAVAFVDRIVARRAAGEPIQYALGVWAFRGLDVMVDRRVLIPRPETELVAQAAIDAVRTRRAPVTAVDLGTGCGAIALAIASEVPIGLVKVWAVDISPDALAVASANLAGLGRPAACVRLVESDWFEAMPEELRGAIDVLVANPPYVADHEVLASEVVDYEPRRALYAGPTGLECVTSILVDARAWLADGADVIVEMGATQGPAAAALARDLGYRNVEVRRDLAGRDRFVVARYASSFSA